ncbi:MAG TPA: hypothetical protein VEF90_03890 [Xanthobacteraceae bacterium]|nr:hypothetical protein [Xanthobacteraceae bacterium]
MRSDSNVYYLERKPARAIAVARVYKRPSREFVTTGFYIVSGAVLGFGLANLPTLSAALMTALHIVPAHLI